MTATERRAADLVSAFISAMRAPEKFKAEAAEAYTDRLVAALTGGGR